MKIFFILRGFAFATNTYELFLRGAFHFWIILIASIVLTGWCRSDLALQLGNFENFVSWCQLAMTVGSITAVTSGNRRPTIRKVPRAAESCIFCILVVCDS